MSKNFEVLQRAQRDREFLGTTRTPVIPLPAPAANPPLPLSRTELMVPELDAAVHDEVDKLIQRLFLLSANAASPHVVLFTGVGPGDGNSWICARAGEMAAAKLAGSVCVVDANLRSPTLHECFGVPNDGGLTGATVESGPMRNFAHQLGNTNLWFVPCGTAGSDIGRLISSDRLRTRLAELRTEFDYVLIDSPAAGVYNDAVILGQLTDGVVLVIGASTARRDMALRAMESLAAAKVRVLGAVLNRRTFPIPEALYRRF